MDLSVISKHSFSHDELAQMTVAFLISPGFFLVEYVLHFANDAELRDLKELIDQEFGLSTY